jgi:O-acetylhomoserine/O-acetylserine sulfhydrylase-like pyridoxal-dependent enzyme
MQLAWTRSIRTTYSSPGRRCRGTPCFVSDHVLGKESMLIKTSSGEAARWMAIAGVVMTGENIVAAVNISEDAYTHFKYRFPQHGISVKFVDIHDVSAIRAAIDDKTRAVYAESISSFGLEITDIEAVASVAHESGVPLIVLVRHHTDLSYRVN